jgi:hypothetical protein
MDSFPRMFVARQRFPKSTPVDIPAVVAQGFAGLAGRIKPGARIAVGVGSRGISNLQEIVTAVIEQLRSAGAKPFIIPAMGSHGGATPEGQTEILAEYGITEANLGVPIHAAMETDEIGRTDDGVKVFVSTEAMRADGIVVINRVKPHTDFASDTIGSGVLKMMVIGLGKRMGAANYHRAALRHGFENVLRQFARGILRSAPILCGVAIVEDYFHATARIAVLPREEMESGEAALFAEAKRLMPKLPFDEIDLLIIDRIGKNISGSGMDPNIIGREVHGYSSSFDAQRHLKPVIRRILVCDLTPETLGNGIGIGLADFTTSRLVRAMDLKKTFINSLTSLTPNGAKTPIYFDSDREALAAALTSLAIDDISHAKVIRIADTLSLEKLWLSEACLDAAKSRSDLEIVSPPQDITFDNESNFVSF